MDNRELIIRTIRQLEHSNEKQGVYYYQVRDYINKKDLKKPIVEVHFMLDEELTRLAKEGLIFTNKAGEKFSFYKSEKYRLLEERMPRKPETHLNYAELISNLMNQSMDDSSIKPWSTTFLDGLEDIKQIAVTSFPRSGNTMSRKHLEDITGIFTGDHCSPDFSCDLQLIINGL